jgi:multicomponent Na+:H+ antiporter subunit C
LTELIGLYNYWVFALLLVIGLYAVVRSHNLFKKLLGLSIFQSAVFLFYITLDKVEGGTAPIVRGADLPGQLYANPLPQVLILTAIVVAISTSALALAIIVRIKEEYGTIEDDEIEDLEAQWTR